MVSTKRCTKCQVEQSLEQFSKGSGKQGRQSRCRKCIAEQHRARTHANPLYNFKVNLRSKYGMTLEDYDRLVAQQNGRCAICGTNEPKSYGGRFAVDHDHATGTVRALLCNCCNMALGHMADDPERLEAAARYLRAFGRN